MHNHTELFARQEEKPIINIQNEQHFNPQPRFISSNVVISMAERKNKRETEELEEIETEENGFLIQPTQVEVGSGYTMSVSYDEHDKPIVDVKTYGEVNLSHLRREILKAFPNAQIRQLNQSRTILVAKKHKKKRKPTK
jgi:hypothetical protein